ncbi:MAG: flagellar biosynthetic protein FliO [Thermodesulfobacteriota bacterium]|nr:flagellar biosynthetic protein FliO [Thermodesulfobacteriota bacterium]
MNDSLNIWSAFARTAVMLTFVIALLFLILYLFRRFSSIKGKKGTPSFIKVLSVHHFSPKEKIVLVDVMQKKVLVGITSASMNTLAVFENHMEGETEQGDADED